MLDRAIDPLSAFLSDAADTLSRCALHAVGVIAYFSLNALLGTSLLTGFRLSQNGLSEGQIYNPENGRTYRSLLKLRNPDLLEVKGCLLFICETQVWRRADSVCKALPHRER